MSDTPSQIEISALPLRRQMCLLDCAGGSRVFVDRGGKVGTCGQPGVEMKSFQYELIGPWQDPSPEKLTVKDEMNARTHRLQNIGIDTLLAKALTEVNFSGTLRFEAGVSVAARNCQGLPAHLV